MLKRERVVFILGEWSVFFRECSRGKTAIFVARDWWLLDAELMNDELPVWGWVSGWGISVEIFKEWAQGEWPGYAHVVVEPREGAVEELRKLNESGKGLARVGGYSLGALLLLSEGVDLVKNEGLLLAPFLGFCKEDGLGGRVERRSLERLRKLFQRNARWGLVSFYDFAGLNLQADEGLPYAEDDLAWGLEQLLELRVEAESVRELREVICCYGDRDALIEGTVFEQVFGDVGLRTRLVQGAGHDFRKLGGGV